MDRKERMQYAIDHYDLMTKNYEEGLSLARPVLLRYDGKNFNKRLINQINEVANRFDDLITVIKNPYSSSKGAHEIYIYPRMYNLPDGEVMYAQGLENIIHFSFCIDADNKFIAEPTIKELDEALETRKTRSKRLKNELENYDALLKEKEKLLEMVREHNQKIIYSDELKISSREVW